MTVTHEPVWEAAKQVLVDNDNSWPWGLIGVAPTELDVDRLGIEIAGGPDWNFVYTVGVTSSFDFWIPCQSIEGRRMPTDLAAMILNWIAAGYKRGVVDWGDDVTFPIGSPDGPDLEAVFWIGQPEWKKTTGARRQANYSDAAWVVPILWSSPLGWPE